MTGYVLANPGEEYLVLQPGESAEAFMVELPAGSYAVEWYSVNSRETVEADKVTVESSSTMSFCAPFGSAGPTVTEQPEILRLTAEMEMDVVCKQPIVASRRSSLG